MDKESNYPFDIVDKFNDGLKLFNKELQIVQREGTDRFSIDIIDINDDGETLGTNTFAENLSEEELFDFVIDASYSITNGNDEEVNKDDLISFKIVRGGTHEMPALIYAFTSVDLFFHDFDTDGIERVSSGSIDDYRDRNGEFCVHKDDYDVAQQQIYEHDELGIEH
jgi:hypothetical protein